MSASGHTRAKSSGLRFKADHTLRLILAVFREIFDESAYARFLDRNRMQPSRATYAAFRNEHEHTKAHRPRCC